MATRNKRVLHDSADHFTGVVEDDIPQSPPDGVVVKVQFAGICHSDVHIAKAANPKYTFPRVMGHEIGGVIYELGDETAKAFPNLKKDDRVVVYPWGNCKNCTTCRADLPYCPNMVLPTGAQGPGSYVYGVWQDGGYQDYVLVHDPQFLVSVPDDVSMSAACMVPCSGITAHSATKTLRTSVETAIKLNGKAIVAVFGAGGLALWAIQIIKAILPPEVKVVAVDLLEEKLKDAKDQGADVTFQWGKDDSVAEVVGNFMKQVGGFIDGAIDFTGLASVQEKIFALLNVGGTITLIGLGGMSASLPLIGIILKNATIKGNYVGSKSQCAELFTMMQQGKVKPPPITEVSLEDMEKTLKKLETGEQRGRAVVKL